MTARRSRLLHLFLIALSATTLLAVVPNADASGRQRDRRPVVVVRHNGRHVVVTRFDHGRRHRQFGHVRGRVRHPGGHFRYDRRPFIRPYRHIHHRYDHGHARRLPYRRCR